ncbi:hypothetical protein FB563_1882 [Streptomyces puniciscabiei]|uniref:Uncharacterized protein n=1 Tax=Streptomyces puniciscabiei TaxID=164348 RepID=A0A542UCW9_9ACTN|nr:hypothetical protein [Streptomyces puniciscabiei]TQK96929.1 hypothetical protein FB563_1882 [Streptomyces puniciscabiei]
MKLPRSTVVTAGVASAAALAATGITYASAASAPAPQSAPAAAAAAPLGGDNGQGKGNEGWSKREEGDWGRIQINERSYSAHPGDCITVVSGLGARSLNIRNDSHKTVEVFRGVVCDNGAPIATVGPHSSADGVHVGKVDDIRIKDGVVASFRVIHRDGWGGGDWDGGNWGGGNWGGGK